MTKKVKIFSILNSFFPTLNPCISLETQGLARLLQRESLYRNIITIITTSSLYSMDFYAHIITFFPKLDISVALFWQCCGFFILVPERVQVHFNYSFKKKSCLWDK